MGVARGMQCFVEAAGRIEVLRSYELEYDEYPGGVYASIPLRGEFSCRTC